MSSYLNCGLESPHAGSWGPWILGSVLVYIPFCTAIRRHQRQRATRRHGALENMTLDEAYAIKSWMAEHEFPRTFSAALDGVFFKAEAIPSIAKLVFRAAQRSSSKPQSSPSTSTSPAALLGPPSAPETLAAIARVNRIHALYRPAGTMSDTDLLYVLSLFALEPLRYIQRFEPRAPTREQRCALATMWRAVGEALRVPFDPLLLKSHGGGEEEGFRDALHWLDELERWGAEYEMSRREKSVEGVRLARMKFEKALGGVPWFCKGAARGMLAALYDEGFRGVMGIEPPSRTAVVIIETVVCVRKFLRGYFCSPVALVKGYRRGR
ncbi:hypothetical protein GGS24DRAFT_488445 [Hypoxylon argillaceum]|nr:hypothetical protein GGS24DRAFT_488445 [Hypoxylon argillaceum]